MKQQHAIRTNSVERYIHCQIMEDLQDTTLGAQMESAVVEFLCINNDCNKSCKSTDEGVNPHMKYCNACSIKLTADLAAVLNMEDSEYQHQNGPLDDAAVDTPGDWQSDPPDDTLSELPEDHPIGSPDDLPNALLDGPLNDPPCDMSMRDIEDAVETLVRTRDMRQYAIVMIGKLDNGKLFAVPANPLICRKSKKRMVSKN